MRTFIIAGALAAAAAILPSAASATVVVTDESRAQVHVMDQLEQGLRARFGGAPVDASRDAYGFIWVGRSTAPPLPTSANSDGRPHPGPPAAQPMLLMKDVTGWYGWHTGRKAKLPRAAAQELDAILTGEQVWTERTTLLSPCRAGARIFWARHAGRDLVRRECGSTGLAARLGQIAATGRASGKPLPQTRGAEGSRSGGERALYRHIFERSDLMAASWERGDLAGYLEPYAEDVTIVRPGGTIRGREALIAWARREREWKMGAAPALRLQGTSFAPQVGDSVVQTREYRLEKNGREMKRIVTARWQNRGGLWRIVREEWAADVSA